MDRLLNWLEWPIHALMWLGLLAGALMMGHITLDVAGRAPGVPIEGTPEIVSGYYMIAVAYFPWAMVARRDDHIMVELFTQKMSPQTLFWIDTVVKMLTAIYVAIFTWQTWRRAFEQMEAREAMQVGATYMIVWPSRYFLPVAGFFMVLYLVLRVIKDIQDGAGGHADEGAS